MEKLILSNILYKFSNAWNILRYYGYLHNWKRLMVILNTKTRTTWAKNLKAFWFWIAKKDVILKEKKDFTFNFLSNLQNFKYVDHVFASGFKLKDFINKIAKILAPNQTLIIDYAKHLERTWRTNLLGADSEGWYFDYKLHIIKEHKISEILPGINCKNHKIEFFDWRYLNNQEYDKIEMWLKQNALYICK